MGVGHLARCKTLATALAPLCQHIIFICRDFAGQRTELLNGEQFTLLMLPSQNQSDLSALQKPAQADWLGCDWQQDVTETTNALNNTLNTDSLDLLIVDHYGIDERWESALRPQTKAIMVIDDLADRPHDADILLDQTLHRSAEDYQPWVTQNCQLLCGSRYALLRPEFQAYRQQALHKPQTNIQLNNILISLGGSDPQALSLTILQSFIRLKPQLPEVKVKLVLGAHSPALKQAETLCKKYDWLTLLIDCQNMAQEMLQADLAIGAAGTTAWERCCLGLPTLVLQLADNQKLIAQNLCEAGAAMLLTSNEQALSEELDFLLLKFNNQPQSLLPMQKAAFNLCDGMGSQRIVFTIKQLFNFPEDFHEQ